jgi:benzoyl-CoA reductase/2-hydroxyglutaryl-CoA dehydratase subunit BcrC/BadD/HgdB
MSIVSHLKYFVNVKLGARPYIRLKRWRGARKQSVPFRWNTKYLAPPLKIDRLTKELIALHYLDGRYAAGRKSVAWVTSGAPVEILQALGYYVLYPENHAAICGVRRKVVEIAGEAENAGYSLDICSYARTDIGGMLSGKSAVGKLPRPNLLLACTNICQTVLHWYRVLAYHFNIPLIIVDTPFIYTECSDADIQYVKRQLEDSIPIAEKVCRRRLTFKKLQDVVQRSKDASELWLQIIHRGRHRPAPISAFDQFIQMAPIVEMRGKSATVDFYAALLREIDERVKKGIGAVVHERKRLLWDNLPIWYRLRYLAEYLGKRGISVVASTYTHAWGELAPFMDENRPLESMAKTYIYPILNRSTGSKLQIIKRMSDDFHVNGVILHSDRSCKPYSMGQIDQRNKLIREYGIPALLLEADHNDPRSFSEEQVASRLDAFVEMLGI